jgi:DNA-directed RNA polymerase specialized sigma24 family protein
VPEIAKILQLSESAAESRLSRARQAFREGYRGDAQQPAVGEIS